MAGGSSGQPAASFHPVHPVKMQLPLSSQSSQSSHPVSWQLLYRHDQASHLTVPALLALLDIRRARSGIGVRRAVVDPDLPPDFVIQLTLRND